MTETRGEFPKPLFENGRYQLPWKYSENQKRPNVMKFLWERYKEDSKSNVPSQKELDEIDEMCVVPLDIELLKNPSSTEIQVTWLGHASFLVQLDGVNVLFDPVFNDQIGPLKMFGRKRYRRCPCNVEDLPDIDIVCISHDHYDHLDLPTVKHLDKRFDSIRWCVPLGMKEWLLHSITSKNISELNWWDEEIVSLNRNEKSLKVTIACLPAQHWGRRSLLDENTRLWSGWIIQGSSQNVYHAGDTGYCDVFKLIGKYYGPIDLALIPIGNYCPKTVLSFQHVDPEEAVQIHQDVQSKQSIAMHWGTFHMMSKEYFLEPPHALKEALSTAGLPEQDFIVVHHGETVTLSSTVRCSLSNNVNLSKEP